MIEAAQTMKRCHTKEDLALFNLLDHPVWVFDIEKKAMWWANTSSMSLWNADSLESLLNRKWDDMSEATSRRLTEHLGRFRKGERVSDQWTFYPQGAQPATVCCSMSGIYIEDNRMAMLVEADLVTVKEEVEQSSLRGMEMLRHLPVVVCQFDEAGNLMHQNPEAFDVFGAEDRSFYDCTANCTFLSRFVDKNLGRRVLHEVQNGNDFSVEAEQYTKQGPRWSSIRVRRSKDPVNMKPVILYSARDIITDMVEAKKEAEEANIRKTEFLAVMAHEIRTPLHQVVGFIELLSQTTLRKEQTEFVNLLQTSTASLMTVINDLLDYTKLEAGKMNLEIVPFEPRGVVEGSLAVVGPKAEEKKLLLVCDHSNNIPERLAGDPTRLRQILLNLLQNAAKFTHQGSISLTVSRQPDDEKNRVVLRFVVADTGIGISEKHQKHIFDQYQQADASVARQYGGTGLGLAICKKLAEAMQGTIGLESVVGEGSRFWFEVPFELPSNMEEAFKVTNVERVQSSLRILVAEDNKVNQKLAVHMLKGSGHTVTVVENGLEAIHAVEGGGFDLVLMDVQMPVMDGVEATKRLRTSGWCMSKLPVLGLTASFRTADKDYYQAIGMNDCLGKPIRLEELKKTISRLNITGMARPVKMKRKSSSTFND